MMVALYSISYSSAEYKGTSRLLFLGNKKYAPIVYLEDGTPAGVAVDIVRALSKHISQPIEIRAMDWPEAQQLVAKGEADALIQITRTPEREKIYDFSDPILEARFSIFADTERAIITGLSSLKGLRVGVEAGGLPQQVLERIPEINLTLIPTFADGFRMINAGTIDVVVVDYMVGSYVLAKNNIRGIRPVGEPIAFTYPGIAVKKGNEKLISEINNALKAIRRDGTYDDIIVRWKPKEVIFHTREQITQFIYLSGAIILLITLLVVIAWTVTLRKELTARRVAEQELRRYKDDLEETIRQRTAELLAARDTAEAARAANAAKSAFLANISHELRTPLNAILGFSALLRSDPQATKGQRDRLDIINRSGEHLLKLIDDVLEVAKIEAGRVKLEIAPFDLGAMVRDVADMMRVRAEEKGLRLTVDESSAFPRYIKGDEARLRQVLVNLAGNAVKFTTRGAITIRLGSKQNGVRYLVMEVEDTGPGISEDDQKRLFKPFTQLGEAGTQKGTGLGLAISHQFVELMGGIIGVTSTVGKGSVFRAEIPVQTAEAAEAAAQGAARVGEIAGLAPGTPTLRILIAEDQLENQMLLSDLMNRIGLEVKAAANGQECVSLFQEWHPHLIWMDRRMPVMDGIEATRRIRGLPDGAEVKIVAVTASVFKEQQQEMLDAGMDGIVRKPYRPEEIYGCLAKQLGIQYVYRTAKTEAAAAPAVLTPEMLAILDPHLREELRKALESLDTGRIDAVISRITQVEPALGRTLSQLTENFDYPAILTALGQRQSMAEA